MPYFHTHISYFWKKYEELHNFFDGKRLLIKWAFRESYQNLKNINNSWRKKAKSTEFLPFSQDKIGKKCLILGLFEVFWLEKNRLFQILKTVPECCYYQLSSDVKFFSKFPTLFSIISKTWQRMVLYPWYRAKLHIFPLNLIWKLKNNSGMGSPHIDLKYLSW